MPLTLISQIKVIHAGEAELITRLFGRGSEYNISFLLLLWFVSYKERPEQQQDQRSAKAAYKEME